jgi:hypothetical protein
LRKFENPFLLLLELDHGGARPHCDLDVSYLLNGCLTVIHVLPYLMIRVAGHRLVEVATRKRTDYGDHLRRGKAHISTAIERNLGERGRAEPGDLCLD